MGSGLVAPAVAARGRRGSRHSTGVGPRGNPEKSQHAGQPAHEPQRERPAVRPRGRAAHGVIVGPFGNKNRWPGRLNLSVTRVIEPVRPGALFRFPHGYGSNVVFAVQNGAGADKPPGCATSYNSMVWWFPTHRGPRVSRLHNSGRGHVSGHGLRATPSDGEGACLAGSSKAVPTCL
jgi:hypothetical protein